MSKDTLWAISLGSFFVFWLVFPALRTIFSVILLLHIPLIILGIKNLQYNFFCKALCHNSNEKSSIAITFDDGPDPICTPSVLNLLDLYNCKATFFIIAEKALKHPEICKEIIRRGHVIGCHDLNHSITANFRFFKQMYYEITKAQQMISGIIDKTPLFYRPPVGLSNPHLRKTLSKLNMKCIGWSSSVQDAGNRRIHTFKNFHLMARPGSVVLLHDILPIPELKEQYLKELERLLEKVKANNLKGVTVETLFHEKAYK
jgi:peptidoglycan-N-acetylglucosamine deacetylase